MKNIKRLSFTALFIIFFCITLLLKNLQCSSYDFILTYTHKNIFLSIVIMLFLFVLKSFSLFFPISVLYALSGLLFPMPLALAVSTTGLVLSHLFPYLLGRNFKDTMEREIINKYPKMEKIKEFQNKNSFFSSMIVRCCGFLPSDIVSLYFGAVSLPLVPYLLGGLCGSFLSIVTTTLLGNNLSDPFSKEFILVLILRSAILFVSIGIERKLLKKT